MLLTSVLYFLKLFVFLIEITKVYIGLQYQVFWTTSKSNALVTLSWGAGVVVSLSVVAIEQVKRSVSINSSS